MSNFIKKIKNEEEIGRARSTTGKNGGKRKVKAVPLEALCGPEGSRKLGLPDFMTTAQVGGKVVSLTHRPPLPSGNVRLTHRPGGSLNRPDNPMSLINFDFLYRMPCRSQWPRGLRRRSAAASLLRLWVRIPTGGCLFVVSVVCCQVEVCATG